MERVLVYEPSGALQQSHRLKQLELQLLLQRLYGAVRLQDGWQPAQQEQQQLEGGLTAVLLSGADGQWPLLAAAQAGTQESEQQQQKLAVGSGQKQDECSRAAAIDAAIAAPSRLRQRLQAAAGPLAGAEPDFVLVRLFYFFL